MTPNITLGQQHVQRGGGWRGRGSFRSELLSQREQTVPEPEPETPEVDSARLPEKSEGVFGNVVGGTLVYRIDLSYRLPPSEPREVGTRRPGPRLADATAAAEAAPAGPEAVPPRLADELRAI